MGLREIESKYESIFAWKSQILRFIYQELDLWHMYTACIWIGEFTSGHLQSQEEDGFIIIAYSMFHCISPIP